METILVPTDFTPVSENAINYAVQLASFLEKNVTLIHVYTFNVAFTEIPPAAPDIYESNAEAERQILELKEKLLKKATREIMISTEVVRGDVIPQIKTYCENHNVYAIVMGLDIHNKEAKSLFEGIISESIHTLTWPVIIVPSNVEFKKIKKIGLACDFKDVAASVPVDEILKLAKEFNSELHILHVQEEGENISDLETSQATRWFNDHLGDLEIKYHFLVGDDIEEIINDFADHNDLEMLIVTPKSHGYFHRILKSSTSRNIVLNAHVPVLSIHE